jgi:hypothetical protein
MFPERFVSSLSVWLFLKHSENRFPIAERSSTTRLPEVEIQIQKQRRDEITIKRRKERRRQKKQSRVWYLCNWGWKIRMDFGRVFGWRDGIRLMTFVGQEIFPFYYACHEITAKFTWRFCSFWANHNTSWAHTAKYGSYLRGHFRGRLYLRLKGLKFLRTCKTQYSNITVCPTSEKIPIAILGPASNPR